MCTSHFDAVAPRLPVASAPRCTVKQRTTTSAESAGSDVHARARKRSAARGAATLDRTCSATIVAESVGILAPCAARSRIDCARNGVTRTDVGCNDAGVAPTRGCTDVRCTDAGSQRRGVAPTRGRNSVARAGVGCAGFGCNGCKCAALTHSPCTAGPCRVGRWPRRRRPTGVCGVRRTEAARCEYSEYPGGT